MTGLLGDRNEVAESACLISGSAGDWTNMAPLDSLRSSSLIDASVSTRTGTADNPVIIDILFDNPTESVVAGLLDVNLQQTAFWRLERFYDRTMTYMADTTRHPLAGDRRVVPPMDDPADLPIGSPNQLLGNMDPRDYALVPVHIIVPLPAKPITALRWTLYGPAFEADGSAASAYRIGSAWNGNALLLNRHVGASGDSYRPGDTLTKGPGSTVWVEPGIGRRAASIDRMATNKKTRREIFKMMIRVGFQKPVIWLPNIFDWPDNFLFGGVFRRTADYSDKFTSPGYINTTIDIEEWRE